MSGSAVLATLALDASFLLSCNRNRFLFPLKTLSSLSLLESQIQRLLFPKITSVIFLLVSQETVKITYLIYVLICVLSFASYPFLSLRSTKIRIILLLVFARLVNVTMKTSFIYHYFYSIFCFFKLYIYTIFFNS